ncbi:cytochrome P450 [Halobacteriales archaeon QS_1_68_20]|nr:MAG: cytochrome P450 [Halobacteriales archaeon QS_1_68_20]
MSLVPIDGPEALSDPAAKREPFPWFAEMRESDPVRYDPDRNVWDVFTYEHVQAVLGNDERFSVEVETVVGPDDPLSKSMMFSDPPRHDFLQAAVSDFFQPSSIDRYESAVREAAAERIERHLPGGSLDVMNDLGYPMAVVTIAELLGIPREDHETFLEYAWKALQGRTADGTSVENPLTYRRELIEFLGDLIDARRERPREDLVTRLVEAEVDGRSLTGEDLIGFCEMLMIGGAVPATLLTNAVYSLDQVDGLASELAGDEAAIERAVEETLRYRSPTQAVPRLARRDVEVAGREIEAGDRLVSWIASANRDPAVFEDPGSFVYDRDQDAHLAFGTGTHFCLGSRVARMEARVVLSELLDRVDRMAVRTEDAKVDANPIILGFDSLPITFEPASG